MKIDSKAYGKRNGGYNVHAYGLHQHFMPYPGPEPQVLFIPDIASPAITWDFVSGKLAALDQEQ